MLVNTTIDRMGRKRKDSLEENGTPSKSAGKTESVRIDADLAQKLTIVSIRRKKTVGAILSPHIRVWVEQLYRDTLKEMCDEEKPGLG